ncbi:hypothetical protein, partial [Streptomyces sp. 5-10]
MRTYVACVLVVAFLQVAASQTVDINAALSALIGERQRSLGINVGLSNMQFGKSNGAVEANIAIGTSNITDLLVQLSNVVDAAVAEAKAAGKNIDSCVSAVGASVSALNQSEIQSCRVLPQLGQARVKLNQLALVQGNLANVLPKCVVLNPLNLLQVRVCVNGELVNIDQTITQALAAISSLLNDAVVASSECVNKIRSNWENQVAAIEND